MSDKATLDKLRKILRDNAVEEHDWDQVDGDTTFESIGVDSLSILDLLYDVEQEFGVAIEAKEVLDVHTVGEFAALLKQRGG